MNTYDCDTKIYQQGTIYIKYYKGQVKTKCMNISLWLYNINNPQYALQLFFTV